MTAADHPLLSCAVCALPIFHDGFDFQHCASGLYSCGPRFPGFCAVPGTEPPTYPRRQKFAGFSSRWSGADADARAAELREGTS